MTGNQRYLSGSLREDKRVPLVNFRKLPHAFVLGDGLIRNTDNLTLTFLGPKTAPSFSRLFASRCRWGNRVVVAEIVCRDLHDAAFTVGHQNVIVTVFPIWKHLKRLITVAEFCDGGSGYFSARL